MNRAPLEEKMDDLLNWDTAFPEASVTCESPEMAREMARRWNGYAQMADMVKSAEVISGIYFSIAEEVVGANVVRRLFKDRFEAAMAAAKTSPEEHH